VAHEIDPSGRGGLRGIQIVVALPGIVREQVVGGLGVHLAQVLPGIPVREGIREGGQLTGRLPGDELVLRPDVEFLGVAVEAGHLHAPAHAADGRDGDGERDDQDADHDEQLHQGETPGGYTSPMVCRCLAHRRFMIPR